MHKPSGNTIKYCDQTLKIAPDRFVLSHSCHGLVPRDAGTWKLLQIFDLRAIRRLVPLIFEKLLFQCPFVAGLTQPVAGCGWVVARFIHKVRCLRLQTDTRSVCELWFL